MTSLSNAFALYNRLEQHLKRATNDRPLTVNRAYHLSDINDVANAPHTVATAFESLTRKGLVTKVLMGDRVREGTDKNSKVGYFWTPEKVAEHVPPLAPHTGTVHPSRSKPRKLGKGAEYDSQRGAPTQEIAHNIHIKVPDVPNAELLRRMLPQQPSQEAPSKAIRLDFGGKVFTAPEGCKVDVHTAADGLAVTFVLPPTGN